MKNNQIHIIGGGIIGLCSAWYLRQEGFDVTIIDKTDLSDGCSHGNAGMIVPSHFVPLAVPGVISKGIRWMFNPKSPFYIKPRLNADLMQWLWRFYQSCTLEKAEKSMPILLNFNQWSLALYEEFSKNKAFDFGFEKKGLLMLYKDKKAAAEEKEVAEKAHELGLNPQILSQSAVQALEKNIDLDILGGIYYQEDGHLYPNLFIKQLIEALKKQGVSFLLGNAVTGFQTDKNKITAIELSNGQQVKTKKIVLASGSWSAKILKQLGVKILLQDGKGYSITLKNPRIKPSIPTILTEAKVAVTPMGNDLRIGGTLEISQLSPKINAARLAGILESMPKYYPQLKIKTPPLKEVWHGFRPCTPDGLPHIGKAKKYNNLTIATGHAMMGMSLGAATGKLVSEIITDQKTTISTDLFIPER